MTTYYVGPGGSNANNGTSWATRKLTLNGAEDIPVAAGDTVYVGPGVYRELLTVDVSGTAGNPITYIGDVTGAYTDGVGGLVRVTGSDNDQTTARNQCVIATTKSYRTFRGFLFEHTALDLIRFDTGCTYCIVQQCAFGGVDKNYSAVRVNGASQANITIQNCVFAPGVCINGALAFTHTATVSNAGHVVQNCLFVGTYGVLSTRVGGITVNGCTFLGGGRYVNVGTALAAGQTITTNNCIFYGAYSTAVGATATGEITEDYNSFYSNSSDRSNTATGANSNVYPPLFAMPILLSGIRYPWQAGALSEWSPLRGLAGTAMLSDDVCGVTRPTTNSKKSWGAVQYTQPARDTGTKRTGAASLKLADASRHQVFAPSANASTVFSCYVYWGADYAGTKPQMVVKQPGQSDVTVTATGSAGSWEQLTTTLTPAANPPYIVVELVSNNTATSGSYATYFDDLTVS